MSQTHRARVSTRPNTEHKRIWYDTAQSGGPLPSSLARNPAHAFAESPMSQGATLALQALQYRTPGPHYTDQHTQHEDEGQNHRHRERGSAAQRNVRPHSSGLFSSLFTLFDGSFVGLVVDWISSHGGPGILQETSAPSAAPTSSKRRNEDVLSSQTAAGGAPTRSTRVKRTPTDVDAVVVQSVHPFNRVRRHVVIDLYVM